MPGENFLREQKILLVGNPGIEHIGAHLHEAARTLEMDVGFLDSTRAFDGPSWLTKLNWWLRGRYPTCLEPFSGQLVQACYEFRPRWMLATGLAPIQAWALKKIGDLGIQRLNYLTDEPWNPMHKAPWFLKALPFYDHIFSVRRSNIGNLMRLGCRQVSYLPFAYAPEIHYPEPPRSGEEQGGFDYDVVFAGGADPDRLPYLVAITRSSMKLGLYGGYWERFRETKRQTKGSLDPSTLRKVISRARVALCLVRRANRDGNSMRTFEIPAIGTCMLTEDTEEHREIFGEEGEAVYYFRSVLEMVQKLRWLLDHNEERIRLAARAHNLIIRGGNTYRDRLEAMLRLDGESKNGRD